MFRWYNFILSPHNVTPVFTEDVAEWLSLLICHFTCVHLLYLNPVFTPSNWYFQYLVSETVAGLMKCSVSQQQWVSWADGIIRSGNDIPFRDEFIKYDGPMSFTPWIYAFDSQNGFETFFDVRVDACKFILPYFKDILRFKIVASRDSKLLHPVIV